MGRKTIFTHGTETGRISVGRSAIRELRFNDELPEAEDVKQKSDPYDERQYIRDNPERK